MSSTPFSSSNTHHKNVEEDRLLQEIILYCGSRLLAATIVTANAAATENSISAATLTSFQYAFLAELVRQ